jgi:hypothetical protein
MASDYGLNFGFRRSDESMATREGRFKTPIAGTELLQGSAIELDPAVPGYYKQSAAGADPVSGLRGLLVQEEDHIFGAFVEHAHDSFSRGRAKKDQLSVMWAGIGTKVWFRNTDAYSRFGREHEARQLVDLTGVAVGDSLGWDGAKWIKAALPADAWMTVTNVSSDSTYCEAVLTF